MQLYRQHKVIKVIYKHISPAPDEMRKTEEQLAAEAAAQRKTDERYMRQAITQAKKAMSLGEVPIGCVIVYEGRVIGRGYNRRNTDHTTLAHAEISAIRKASRVIGDWRLEGCTLYCTLEPCPMCAGAIEQARIDRVVIGARSDKSGCAGTLLNIVANEKLMHQSEITFDVLGDTCSALLREFFKDLRRRVKMQKKSEIFPV